MLHAMLRKNTVNDKIFRYIETLRATPTSLFLLAKFGVSAFVKIENSIIRWGNPTN